MQPTKLIKKDLFITFGIGLAAGSLMAIIFRNILSAIPQLKIMPLWLWPVVFPFICVFGLLFAYILSKKIPVLYQIGKFSLVGGLNFLIDLGTLNLLMFLTNIAAGWFYSVFKATAFSIAVINSYLFNKFWTFGKKDNRQAGKEFITFLIVSVIGMLINVATASLVVNVIGAGWNIDKNLLGTIGGITAAFAAMFWNFIGYKFIVFKK